MIAAVFHTPAERVRHPIDYAGAALLAGGLSALVLFTSLGGTSTRGARPGWSRWMAGVVLLVAFVFVESRAAEPILPLALFRNRSSRSAARSGSSSARALRRRHLPPALPAEREGPQRHRLGPAADADDGRHARHVDRERPADQPARPLQAVPDRRDGADGGRVFLLSASASRGRPGGALHARARPRARHGDAGARARGPERGRLRVPRRRHLRRDPVPPDRRLDRRRRSSARSSPTGSPQPGGAGSRPASAVPAAVDPRAQPSSRRPVHEAYVGALVESLQPVFIVAAADRGVRVRARLAAPRGAAAADRSGRGRQRAASPGRTRGNRCARSSAGAVGLAARENRRSMYERHRGAGGVEIEPAGLWLLARLGEGTAVDLDDPQADRGRRLAPRTRPARGRPPRRRRRGASTTRILDCTTAGPRRAPRGLGAGRARRGPGDARPTSPASSSPRRRRPPSDPTAPLRRRPERACCRGSGP